MGEAPADPNPRRTASTQGCQDLIAVQRSTGAELVFGHSDGGLISLETARRTDVFRRVAVYEPGVSVAGSMPVSWLGEYQRRLAAGDTRGAFAVMSRGAGHAPAILARAPLSLVKALMYCIPKRQWRQMEPLLATALAENEQIAALDAMTAARFASIEGSRLQMLNGLRHTAPEQDTPQAIADAVAPFLNQAHGPSRGSRDRARSGRRER